jgi:hypothetical protein
MSQRFDLTGIAGNDLSFSFSLTTGSPAVPLNITSLTLTAWLKASSVTPDTLGVTFTTGSGLTVTNAADGQFTWAIPHADVPPVSGPGSLWYRIDLTGSGSTETAMYGALVLTAA